MADSLARVYDRYNLNDRRPNKETSIERLMRQACEVRGIPYDEQQQVGRFFPDLIVTYRGIRAVIECDGPHHLTPKQQVKDRRKDAVYTAQNLPVFRCTDVQIRASAAGCLEDVLHGLDRLIDKAQQ